MSERSRVTSRRACGGTIPQEVDGFLDLVAERMEELVRRRPPRLDRALRGPRRAREVRAYDRRERAVQEALVTAQKLRETTSTIRRSVRPTWLAEGGGSGIPRRSSVPPRHPGGADRSSDAEKAARRCRTQSTARIWRSGGGISSSGRSARFLESELEALDVEERRVGGGGDSHAALGKDAAPRGRSSTATRRRAASAPRGRADEASWIPPRSIRSRSPRSPGTGWGDGTHAAGGRM